MGIRCFYCCQRPPEGQRWDTELVEIVAGRIREAVCPKCSREKNAAMPHASDWQEAA